MPAIDYNRGVQIRRHKMSGIDICMYKDQPGVFMSMLGTPIQAQLAAEAGYDVERLGKEKLRRERIAAAAAVIDAEFRAETQHEVVNERNGVQMVAIGNDRFVLQDKDGMKLADRHFTEPEARRLFDLLAPPDPVPVVPLRIRDEKPPENRPEA
jgi:hypothetical protein